MKKFIYYFYFALLLCLSFLGHYLYDWTNESYLVGFFVPKNESIFEHLKLLFFPSLICLIIDLFINNDKLKTFVSHTFSSSIAVIMIVVLYYTYVGVIGKNIDFVNIGIMIVSIIIYLMLVKFFSKLDIRGLYMYAVLIMAIMIISFIVFSIKTPNLGIFEVKEYK